MYVALVPQGKYNTSPGLVFILCSVLSDWELSFADNLHFVTLVSVHQQRAFFQTEEAGRDGFFRLSLSLDLMEQHVYYT